MKTYPVMLKGCPRCRGDLFPEYEPSGWSLSCLQCGHVLWLEASTSKDGEAGGEVPVLAVPGPDGEKRAA